MKDFLGERNTEDRQIPSLVLVSKDDHLKQKESRGIEDKYPTNYIIKHERNEKNDNTNFKNF